MTDSNGKPIIWQWIAAGLLAVSMALSGFIGGSNLTAANLVDSVNDNKNRITALEQQYQFNREVLQNIQTVLNQVNQNLTAHVQAGK